MIKKPFIAAVLLALAPGAAVRAQTEPSRLDVMPEAIASFGAASSGGFLYVLGGHVGRAHQHSRDNLTSRFQRLDLTERRDWERLPDGRALQSVALVAHGGLLYRIGGMDARNARGEEDDLHSVTDFARFDPKTGTWEDLAPLPSPRSSHDAVVVGDEVWVVGGWTLAGPEREWRTTAAVYSFRTGTWREIPQPFERRALAAATFGGRVHAIGGLDTNGRPSKEVDVYDPATGTWSKGPELPGNGFGASAMGGPSGLFCSVLDGRLLRLAGEGDGWQKVGALTFPRFFHRLVFTSSSEIAFIGGANRTGHLGTIEWRDVAAEAPLVRLAHHRLPNPGRGKNRQGILLRGGELWFFGGHGTLGQHDFGPESFTDDAFVLSLATLQTRTAPDLPAPRQSMQGLVRSRRAKSGLLVGGFGHDGEVARSQSEILAFDFESGAWQKTDLALETPLTQFGITAHGGKAWIFGGLDYDPRRPKDDRFRESRLVLAADLEQGGTFEEAGPDLPAPRRAFGYATLGDRFYLAGGMTRDFTPVEDFLAFDLAEKTWHELRPTAARISPDLVALGERLYLLGGSAADEKGKPGPCPRVEVYDPATDAWTEVLATMPISMRHARAFPHGSHGIVIVSTQNEEGMIDLVLLTPQSRGET